MEAVVDEALGHIGGGHAGDVGDLAQVDDALVAHQAGVAGVEDRERVVQLVRQVVGVEDRVAGGRRQTRGTGHGNVRPGNGQHACGAVGGRGDRHTGTLCCFLGRVLAGHLRVGRQEGGEVRADADRTDTRSAAAVRDGEGLVQVQVTDIAAEIARAGEAGQGVHVRAVDVDLAADRVNFVGDLGDGLLVHAVRGRVGDHDGGDVLAVLLEFRVQVGDVDGAVVGGLDHDDAQVRQRRGGRVGAVRGCRNEADVALGVAVGHVVAADGQQAGQLAGRAGIRLDGHRVVAGDLDQPSGELADQLAPTLGVLVRGERVDVGEAGPRDGLQPRGRVELHRARSQRDHRAVEGQILVAERADVAHHHRLGVVGVEHLVGEHFGGAGELGRKIALRLRRRLVDDAEAAEQRREIGFLGVLAEADGHGVLVDGAHEVAGFRQGIDNALRAARHGDSHGVEERVVLDGQARTAYRRREAPRPFMHLLRDLAQAFRPVVHRVHRGGDRQQRLGGADIGRGFFAADVLLAGLERQAVGRVPLRVDGHAYETARHLALELVGNSHVRGVRAAVEQRHTETLRGAHGDICAELARGFQEQQRQRVGGHGGEAAAGVDRFDHRARVDDISLGARVRQHDADEVFADQVRVERGDFHLEIQGTGALRGDGDDLGVQACVEKHAATLLHLAGHEADGLGDGRGFVEKRRIRDRQACEVLHHRLEIEQCLQAALGDLRLVRGVRGVPAGVLDHAAADDRRSDGGRETLAVEGLEHSVLAGQFPKTVLRFLFR